MKPIQPFTIRFATEPARVPGYIRKRAYAAARRSEIGDYAMTPLSSMDERYRNDAAFHAIVDMLRHAIVKLELSPSEVREAAMFAVYLEDSRRVCDPVLLAKEYSWIADTIRRGGL